ncbi:MAG: DinB family protein [Bacillota bacterium]|nr:DinB family protein [Bacillota bacterium]
MNNRPETNEYDSYYQQYLDMVPEGDLIEILKHQINDTVELLKGVTESQSAFRYAPEKWSLKEVIGHMADTERIMAYRLLCIARGETAALPGFDENKYVVNANFDKQSINDVLENFFAVRQATLQLLKSLDRANLDKKGNANNSEVSGIAIACIIAGHELHHLRIIKERYLPF